MKLRFHQHPAHGSLSVAQVNGRALFPLSGITGIHKIGRFGPEWIASYADKHHVVPVRTRGGADRLLDETTVMDFISTVIDDVDLVDWLINGVIKNLHGVKEPRLAGIPAAADGRSGEDTMNPWNSVSTWLLHPMLAPHLGYSQWVESLTGICASGRARPGIRIGRRPDGTIAIDPLMAMGLGIEAGSFPAMVVFTLIKNHGALAYHESLTTLDSVLRRHSVSFSGSAPVRKAGLRRGVRVSA